MLNLLLGTRRLRNEIAVQSQQLEHDIEHTKTAGKKLKRAAITRLTSPLTLLAAVAAGFATAKIAERASPAPRAKQSNVHSGSHVLEHLAAIGMEAMVPTLINGVQLFFAERQTQKLQKKSASNNTGERTSETTD